MEIQKKNRISKIIENSDYEKGDVCLVTISDIHFTNDNSYGKYNSIGLNSDLENKFNIMKEAANVASVIGCPLIFCGDLIDKRNVDAPTLDISSRFISYLKHISIPDWILIGGNHEFLDVATQFSTLKHYRYLVGALDNRKKGHIITDHERLSLIVKKKNIHFTCLPANHKIEKHIEDSLLWMKKNKNKLISDYKIMLLHGGIQGADLGSMKAPDGIRPNLIDKCSKVFDWVICGDFHMFQFVNGLDNVFYCGAPKQMNAGDIGQKRGYQIVNLTKNTLNFVKSESPTFKRIELIPGEYEHPYIKNTEKYKDKIHNKIFLIKITGTLEKINSIDFEIIKSNFMKYGAVGVYKESNMIREQRNSIKINKDLPIREIISKYVQTKDYDLDKKTIDRHISVLNQYAKGLYE